MGDNKSDNLQEQSTDKRKTKPKIPKQEELDIKQDRIEILLRLKGEKPLLSNSELVKSVTEKWKCSERTAYRYAKQVRDEFKTIEDDEIHYQRGLIIQQCDTVYEKAINTKQYNAAIGAIKQKIDVLGLNKIHMVIDKKVSVTTKEEKIIRVEDRTEKLNEVARILAEVGALKDGQNQDRFNTEVN
ncbi:hypothetical protein KAH94_06765 [bacterium]|nr:hypothetical protein [bacterium]